MLVCPVCFHKVYPSIEGNIRASTSIAVIEVRASAASRCVVELDEEKVEGSGLDCVRKTCIWHDALRRTRDVVGLAGVESEVYS